MTERGYDMGFDLKRHGWAVFLGILAVCLLVMSLFRGGFGLSGSLGDVIISEIGIRNKCIWTEQGVSDYVEFYNPTDKRINLSGIALGDSVSKPKGALPSGTVLEPGGTLLVVLGEKPFGFGLKNGETLTVFGRGRRVIFSYDIDSVSKNTVLVWEDGEYVETDAPSPGYPNTEQGIEEYRSRLTIDSPIRINELCQDNLTLTGSGDWVELINTSGSSYRCEDLYLSDSMKNLFKIKVDAKTWESGELLLVDLGNRDLGKTFGLSQGETLYLFNGDGRKVDELKVLGARPDESQGRDGLLEYPTPGYENDGNGRAQYLASRKWDLVFTEAMSWNTRYLPGPYAATHDYFELYNASDETADISRYAVSKGSDGKLFSIGEGTLAPGETLVVFCEKNATRVLQGYAVVDFGLSTAGDELVLWKDGTPVDTLNIPKLGRDEAYGRNRVMEYVRLDMPSPGEVNWQ